MESISRCRAKALQRSKPNFRSAAVGMLLMSTDFIALPPSLLSRPAEVAQALGTGRRFGPFDRRCPASPPGRPVHGLPPDVIDGA